MPRDVRISWDFPTKRKLGGPVDPSEIGFTEIQFRVTGAPDWTALADVDAPEQLYDQPSLDFGTYDFRLRCHELNGDAGDWGEKLGVQVLDDSPLGAPQNIVVTPQ